MHRGLAGLKHRTEGKCEYSRINASAATKATETFKIMVCCFCWQLKNVMPYIKWIWFIKWIIKFNLLNEFYYKIIFLSYWHELETVFLLVIPTSSSDLSQEMYLKNFHSVEFFVYNFMVFKFSLIFYKLWNFDFIFGIFYNCFIH